MDFESSFNVFRLPAVWAGFFVFATRVSAAIFGGAADELCYVGLGVIPMGWIGAVDLMQAVLRFLIYQKALVPLATEVTPRCPFPVGPDFSVGYIDGFDWMQRMVKGAARVLGATRGSVEQANFAEVCRKLDIPVNLGKRIVQELRWDILGGTMDGDAGLFRPASDKEAKFWAKSLAFLVQPSWSQNMCQHWGGQRSLSVQFQENFVLRVSGILSSSN